MLLFCFRETQEIGIGIVVHDSARACIAWFAHKYIRIATPELAEALAAQEELLSAARLNLQHIQVEGDCTSLIHKLQTSSNDCSPGGPLVHEIRLLALRFHCVFSLVCLTGNFVAHSLARSAGMRLK
ncbi:UNVERIFIED_CONTAM: hypothetical protein Slati_0402900 [Sesamum latifolium]|uniref:RNase H type-1 domain-containing protein n=1 Tax=Sesamum latifolium TaxID=2727402 RepID=A0AAW2XXR7_9LAMI